LKIKNGFLSVLFFVFFLLRFLNRKFIIVDCKALAEIKMKPQHNIRNDVYAAAAARRRQMLEDKNSEAAIWYKNNPDNGPGGCLCILIVSIIAIIVYTLLFFAII
jgi:hypothetical protein